MGIPWTTFAAYTALPDKLERIIAAYSATLANLPERPILHPISALPYPKETIESALKEAANVTEDNGLKGWLQGGLLGLNRFVPESEITEDEHEAVLILLGQKK